MTCRRLSVDSRLPRVGRLFLLAAGTCLVSSAWALQIDDQDYPVSFSIGHSVTRDSNFSRTETPVAETTNSTTVSTAINKLYGRQRYALSAAATSNRYARYGKLLNNVSGDVSGSFSTEFLRDWKLDVGGYYSRALNPIQKNISGGDRVVRNLRRSYDANAALRYGINGLWSVSASADYNVLRYSELAYRYFNADQQSASLRTNYYLTDLFVTGVGYRAVRTAYPERLVNSASEVQNDQNIDLTANWQVTGLSSLDLLLSRRYSTFRSDDTRKIRGWNGSLGWRYTPGGLFSYSASYGRYSSADRQVDDNTFLMFKGKSDVATLQDTTSMRVAASAALTAKTSVSLAHGLTKTSYSSSNQGFFATQSSFLRDTLGHNTSLELSYSPIRTVDLRCAATLYSQSKDQYGYRFNGRSYNCSATLTLD